MARNIAPMQSGSADIDERAERRMLHHQGDGTFTVDGNTIDLKEKIVASDRIGQEAVFRPIVTVGLCHHADIAMF